MNPSTTFYRIPDVQKALNLSRSKIYELIKAGRLHSVKEGRARLVPVTAITEYVRLLTNEATGAAR